MSVTGIEISETAIGLARTGIGLDIRVHHGSVTDMPFDARRYDGVFSFGLLYLLDSAARAKFLRRLPWPVAEGRGHELHRRIEAGSDFRSGDEARR